MKFKEWKAWMNSYPIYLRWFIWLVLVRPIVDNLYHLKNISPFISPPYIVGVLSPILAVWAILKYDRPKQSPIDLPFRIWAAFVILATTCFFLFNPLSVLTFEFSLKLLMPLYLFFFLRLFIKNKKDLVGILQTYLYSALFVVALFLFEVLIAPIRVELSRGLERIQGNFADVMNYGLYINIGFLLVAYFFFRNRANLNTKSILVLSSVTILCILGLTNINHGASYGVFISLVLLFVFYNLKINTGNAFLVIALGIIAFSIFGGETIEKYLQPIVQRDIQVYEGEVTTAQLLHGRVGRWMYMFEDFSSINFFSQLVGITTTFRESLIYINTGTHSDFLRILFLSGYLGFVVFMSFIFSLYKRSLGLNYSEKFLALGALAILMLYSVTANPTMYAPLLYIIFSIFAFVALPRQEQ